MTVPSQMSLRRIPDALHLHVRVAYAASWEALIDTHTRQAVQLVTEFAPRVSVLRGLDLYFQVSAVPTPRAVTRPTPVMTTRRRTVRLSSRGALS